MLAFKVQSGRKQSKARKRSTQTKTKNKIIPGPVKNNIQVRAWLKTAVLTAEDEFRCYGGGGYLNKRNEHN